MHALGGVEALKLPLHLKWDSNYGPETNTIISHVRLELGLGLVRVRDRVVVRVRPGHGAPAGVIMGMGTDMGQ